MDINNILNELSNFIFTSKYARYNEKLKRRETWSEAVNRLFHMHLKKFKKLSADDLEKMEWAFSLVQNKRVVPSMRSLQFGGRPIEAKNSRMFNCAVRHVDSTRAFAEIFHSLLCGNGMGIGLSKHFLGRLPDLVTSEDKTGTVITYVIEDTIEGWADSIEALLLCYMKNTAYTGRKICFDYSKIRKKGTPLKTGGGKAPGYKGLKNAHLKIKALLDFIIEENKQTRLKSIDAYDILMHCSDAVLSGGIRRSATSVIFEKDDIDMMEAKTFFIVEKKHKFGFNDDTSKYVGDVKVKGRKYHVELNEYDYNMLQNENKISWSHIEPQRARSNNSVLLLRSESTKEELSAIIQKSREFGEPGFAFANHPWTLFNPCQPAFAPIIGQDGLKTMGDVKIGDLIWSETGWTKVINKWSTGVKDVYSYKTRAGVFYGTENHKIVQNGEKVEAKDAESVDVLSGPEIKSIEWDSMAIMDGLMIGDGTQHNTSAIKTALLIGEKDLDYFTDPNISSLIVSNHSMNKIAWVVTSSIESEDLVELPKREIPQRYIYNNATKIASFLRGLYSANGSICADRVTLKSASIKLIEQVQLMLSSLGIKSYYTTNKAHMVEWHNGNYESKESYDLNITTDRIKFKNLIGFIQKYKMEKLEEVINSKVRYSSGKKNYEIVQKEYLGKMEVFDITVDNQPHTYWTGGLNVSNCFEISFIPVTEDGVCGVQMCNLTSINGAKVKTLEDFLECVTAATIIGTLQAAYTQFEYLNQASRKLTEEEALLGVSITGMMDSPDILLNPECQRKAAELAVQVNKEWAARIGIKPAARVTCVKPEGTSSLVLGCASGIHPHHARNYIRRVQCNKIDNVYKYFKKQNSSLCEESIWSANKTDDVISFPLSVSEKAILKEELNAIKHLEIIKSTQQNWVQSGTSDVNKKDCAHNVSCTVLCKDDEWDKVTDYLYENRNYFSAVSLLPACGDKIYKQAPLEKMETVEEMKVFNKMKEDFKAVDYTKLVENDDETSLQQEVVCAGGNCEIVRV